ncbi:Tox-REase-5 domain-containing protein, partial [Photorhabdus asymbiotica]
KVTFDGWQPKRCLFLEAKARYDQFFDSKGKPKSWWKGAKSGKKQAERHQTVCNALDNMPHVEWHFLQPISYKYFKALFIEHKNISVHYTPCSDLMITV